MSRITDRIERKLGLPGLAERLADALTPTELQSLLLEVNRRRSRSKTPSRVLTEYDSNRFVAPSAVSPIDLAKWDRIAFKSLPSGFETIELSPIVPLGTCAAVAEVSQDWSVTTVRNTEVISDSTNAMALESAKRRRELLRRDAKSDAPVHLAASHRLVRPQALAHPRHVAHFRLFAMTSAGRDLGDCRFEHASFETHLGCLYRALRSYLGPDVPLRLIALPFGPLARLREPIEGYFEALGSGDTRLETVVDPDHETGVAYYRGLRFRIDTVLPGGDLFNLADGGVVDWTARLLSNRKERFFISGLGSELLVKLLGPG